MAILSALDDLLTNTLSAIDGPLSRVRYLGSLRDETGCYHHWGLERVHGRQQAVAAISEAHNRSVAQTLRTRIRDLVKDEHEIEHPHIAFSQIGMAVLSSRSIATEKLFPDNASEVTKAHLESVVEAVNAVRREQAKRKKQRPRVH